VFSFCRFIQTQSKLATPSVHPHDGKMSATPQWRGFSLNQWRQFRDQLLKLQSEGMFLLNKEWSNLLQKLPPITSKQDVLRLKRFHPYSSQSRDSKIANDPKTQGDIKSSTTLSASVASEKPVSATPSPTVPPQAAAPLVAEETGFSYLQLLTELNWRLTSGISKAVDQSKVVQKAKWRTHEETITKVRKKYCITFFLK